MPLARALRDRDAEAANRALAELGAQFDQPGGMSDAERASIRSAGGRPMPPRAASRGSRRRCRRSASAASGAAAASGAGLNSQELRELLSEGAADTSALDELEHSLTNLSQLRATTLPPNATLVPARGTPTAYALVRGTPPPNATLVAVPGGAQRGGRAGPRAAAGPTGAGARSGDGPAGQRRRRGPGYGDTPSQGQPPTSTSDASSAAGDRGPQVAPNTAPATSYDAVYAPSHLGGDE